MVLMSVAFLASFVTGLMQASIRFPGIANIGLLFVVLIYTFISSFLALHGYNFIAKRIGGIEYETSDQSPT